MMGFNLGARAETVVITVRGAATPRQLIVRSLAVVARATLEAVGLVSVVTLAAFTRVPTLRTPARDAGTALWVVAGGHVEAVPEEADDETTTAAPQVGEPVVLD